MMTDLFKEMLSRLSDHGVSHDELLTYSKEDAEELLKDVFKYNVIDRNKIKKELWSERGGCEAVGDNKASSQQHQKKTPLSDDSNPQPSSSSQISSPHKDDITPQDFVCPISGEMMDDPVFTCDGHTYSRTAIMRWFEQHPNNPTSPNTGLPVQNTILTPNHSLRSQVLDWRQRHCLPPPSPRPAQQIAQVDSGKRLSTNSLRFEQQQSTHINETSPRSSVAPSFLRDAFDDSSDDEGMIFTPESLERIAVIQGTLARSRATINFMQRSVNSLRQQLNGSRNSGLKNSIIPAVIPSIQAAGGRHHLTSFADPKPSVSCRTCDGINLCTDCRIAQHRSRYGWVSLHHQAEAVPRLTLGRRIPQSHLHHAALSSLVRPTAPQPH